MKVAFDLFWVIETTLFTRGLYDYKVNKISFLLQFCAIDTTFLARGFCVGKMKSMDHYNFGAINSIFLVKKMIFD